MNITDTMELTHWVDKEHVDKVLSGDNTITPEMPFKPKGIWLSVNGGWEDWLDGNWQEWLVGKVKLKATLKEDLNLFVIYNQTGFEEMWYKATGERFTPDYLYKPDNTKTFHQYLYDNYDGVRMVWIGACLHRLNNLYFYSWDCSCIVVFEPKNVSFKVIT